MIGIKKISYSLTSIFISLAISLATVLIGPARATALPTGLTGAWTTSSHSLPEAVDSTTATVYNGYVYMVGGYSSSALDTVFYAKLNSDGSVGNWNSSSNLLPQTIDGISLVSYKGFLYALGGYNVGTFTRTNAAYYAPINDDGSVGAWTGNSNPLPDTIAFGSAVVNNGYLYYIGGFDGNDESTVYYSQINNDGSVGSWTTSPNSLPEPLAFSSALVNNGRVYEVGGMDDGSGITNTYYASLNNDGSVGSWNTNPSTLPQAISNETVVANGGYIYSLGGQVLSIPIAPVYYAAFNSDGTIGNWNTNPNPLPQALTNAAGVANNGYVYEIGGADHNGSAVSTVYYAQFPDSAPLSNSAMIQRPNGETDIVTKGPNNELDYYFNAQGSSNWGKLTVAGSGSAYSIPSVIQRSTGETDIVVEGPNNSLNYYYNAQGSPNWGKLTVAGNSSDYSQAAILQRSNGETDIMAEGPNNSLNYYFNAQGSPNWGSLQTAGGGSVYSAPAIIQRSTGETDAVAQGANNNLNYYFNAQGSSNWGKLTVAGSGSTNNSPNILQRASGETDVVSAGVNGSLNYYFNAQGSPNWGALTVAGSGSTNSQPSIIQRSTGETDLAVEGANNSLNYYFNAQGSPNWGALTVAGSGSTYSPPNMLQRSNGETDLTAEGSSNKLNYYFNAQGSPNWGALTVAGSGSDYQ